jgi:hypothetical protein
MNSSNKLQAISNIATIVVSLLLSVVLVKQFLLPPPQGLGKGTSLKSSLAGVDWTKNRRTLVLAISTGCHFCSESGPFFQKIANQRDAGVKLLAVLPQPVAQGRAYLDGLGVHVDDVLQAPLNSIGVTGTPTILLVDRTGKVLDVWVGELPPEREQQVLGAVKKNAPV